MKVIRLSDYHKCWMCKCVFKDIPEECIAAVDEDGLCEFCSKFLAKLPARCDFSVSGQGTDNIVFKIIELIHE